MRSRRTHNVTSQSSYTSLHNIFLPHCQIIARRGHSCMSLDTISCSRICTNIELVLQPEELKSNTSSGRPGMGSFSDRSMFFLGDKHRAQDTTRAGALQFGALTQGQSISMAAMGMKGTDRDARTRPPVDLLEDGSWFVSKTSSWILVSLLSITSI